jgi:two-component system NtrC family sensor kinase
MTDMRKRILVVDDEETFRSTIAKALGRQGYRILDAASGEEGLRLAAAELPDLILSDVTLGGLDGFDLLKELHGRPSTATIPVILMTGGPEAGGVRKSMELGADDYLHKPFSVETLLAAVRARLERQRELQAQARSTETRLLELLAATQDLVAIADVETQQLSYLNPAGRRLLGIAMKEDVTALRLSDFHADGQEQSAQQSKMAEAQTEGIWVGESILVSREGRRVCVSKQMVAHNPCGEGRPYLSIVARDITERLAAEQERQRIEVQLRQAQKLEAIGRLAAGIAHEINTPTQYVGDNTRFLQESFLSLLEILKNREDLISAAKSRALTPELIAQAQELSAATDLEYLRQQIPSAIGETIEGVERISKIVRAMKEFSHPGGKDKKPADLNRAIETTTTVARNEWKYVADLQLELDSTLPAVPCCLGEFNQAILNLVINAAHAIGDAQKKDPSLKGRITVQTRRDGAYAEVRVSDTGTGIPEAIRPRIFEPFFTTKEVGRGTGQGLSMVYNCVVTKHSGTVTFESEVDKGTTFILRLPTTPSPEGQA